MIEPRAWRYRTNNTHTVFSEIEPPDDAYDEGTLQPLTTVADVLAALREPSEAMLMAGWNAMSKGQSMRLTFLAMLDQFERDQGSAT